MLEAAVILTPDGKPIYWHTPPNRLSTFIPDSDDFWDAIWEHRAQIGAIAHSHPGTGFPAPSPEDLTTFEAVERGLGRCVTWWITSQDGLTLVRRHTHARLNEYTYEVVPLGLFSGMIFAMDWLDTLRDISYQFPKE